MWALVCYVPVCGIGPLAGLAILALARRRAWLRFHAWQGVLLATLAAAVVVGLWLVDFALERAGLPTPGLVTVVLQLIALAAYVGVSLRAMVLAYQRRDAALPLIGARARRWAGVRGDEEPVRGGPAVPPARTGDG